MILAFAIGGAVGTKTLESQEAGVGESGEASKAAFDAFPKKAEETVLVQGGELKAGRARVRRRCGGCGRPPERDEGRREGREPLRRRATSPRSRRTSTRRWWTSRSRVSPRTREDVEKPLATVAAAQKANPDFRIEEFGDASAEKGIGESFEEDFQKAGDAVAPDHADHPGVAFGAWWRRASAAAGAHGRGGHARALALAEPDRAGGRVDPERDAADRAGRGRRLLALLPPARARGAADGRERGGVAQAAAAHPAGRC